MLYVLRSLRQFGVFEHHGVASKPFRLASGLRQGCPLFGATFSLLLDPLLRWAIHGAPRRSEIRAFADDLGCAVSSLESAGAHLLVCFEAMLRGTLGLRL